MPLTITLRREASDRAAVLIDGDRLATFELAALRGFKGPPADPKLAVVPWEYLYAIAGFVILDYLFVRVVRDADLPDAVRATQTANDCPACCAHL